MNEYKTFTVCLDKGSLLDDFAPTEIERLSEFYAPVRELKDNYIQFLSSYIRQMEKYNELLPIVKMFSDQKTRLIEIFTDIENRMEYFTCVMIGGVSAGKTSMICDLVNSSPPELNTVLQQNAHNFDPNEDDIQIGPSVATVHLYEFLIESSKIRLIDVPGIGGVVHENSSLAPFVNMADCVLFLIHASNDIDGNDIAFINDHVSSPQSTENLYRIEDRRSRRMIIAINKWKSEVDHLAPAEAEDAFEKKKNWILWGNSSKGFNGISEYFSGQAPKVVKTETRRRNDSTGEPYDRWSGDQSQFDVDELLQAFQQVLEQDGALYRVTRPLRVLRQEFRLILNKLQQLDLQSQLQSQHDVLNNVRNSAMDKQINIQEKLNHRLDSFERRITDYLAVNLKYVLSEWKPKVGFWAGAKGIFDKDGMQSDLKERWGEELRDLIDKGLDRNKLNSIVNDEAKTFAYTMSLEFRLLFEGKNDEVLVAVADSLDRSFQSDSSDNKNIDGKVLTQLERVTQQVEMGILKDIVGVLTVDLVLAVLLSTILSPAGAALIAAMRRMWRGRAQSNEAKDKLHTSLDLACAEASADLKSQLNKTLTNHLTMVSKNIQNSLGNKANEINAPLKVAKEAKEEVSRFSKRLERYEADLPDFA